MTPELRFPEFSDEWQEKRLGDFSTMFSGGTPTSTDRGYYSGSIPFIKSGEISADTTSQNISEKALSQSSAKFVEEGDILFALYGATSGEVAISKIHGAINQAILCIRPDANRYFLYLQFRHRKGSILSKYLQGGQGNLSSDIVKKLRFFMPSKPEQEKIADFLMAVDARIDAQARKVKKLENYKRGVMQQIFSQKIRFKDDNGNPYPDWQEKKLGEIGKTFNGLSGKSGDDFVDGDKKFITYMQIFRSSKIDADFGKVKISSYEKQNTVQKNDILFTGSSETPEETGFASVMLDQIEDVYLNSFCFGYRAEGNDILGEFAQYLFHSPKVRKKIVRLAQGSTRYNISKIAMMSLSVELPVLEEQEKIANFLTSLDDKITAEKSRLAFAKQWKKGLMQKMFV